MISLVKNQDRTVKYIIEISVQFHLDYHCSSEIKSFILDKMTKCDPEYEKPTLRLNRWVLVVSILFMDYSIE